MEVVEIHKAGRGKGDMVFSGLDRVYLIRRNGWLMLDSLLNA